MGEPTFTTTRLGKVECQACGHPLDAATHAGGSELDRPPVPVAGDITACFRCLTPLQFTAGIANALGLKLLDWSVLDEDPETKADLEETIRRLREAR